VDFLKVYPLSFLEFLDAIGEDYLAQYMSSSTFAHINAFHDRLLRYHKLYMFIGGMPEVVNEYIDSSDFSRVRDVQNGLLNSYQNDFSKYTTALTSRKLNMLFNSIPSQVAKENKKFIYGLVKTGARARDFEYQKFSG
jgi:predicted AAA+ superfamily ATPase